MIELNPIMKIIRLDINVLHEKAEFFKTEWKSRTQPYVVFKIYTLSNEQINKDTDIGW